jgi:hypothetical protein
MFTLAFDFCITSCHLFNRVTVRVEWLALLLHIQEIPGSKLGPKIRYLD